MIKYIDAELLKKGLKELESVIYSNELVGQSMHPYDCGQLHAIKVVKELINHLQQVQSCDTCTNDKGCVACKDGELWEGKEQPSEELEAEVRIYCGSSFRFNYDELNDSFYSHVFEFDDVVELARHFYELGKNSK